MNHDIITMDHGSGGGATSRLIEELLVPAFQNPQLSALGDGALLDLNGPLVFSTDSFVIDPVFFPGGDIGKLAVCGTVNDVAMCGGTPKYLSLSFILEEGFPLESLKRIVTSIADTAESCGVSIVTGDTKVVEKGRGDGIYINTAGIGTLTWPGLSPANLKSGDKVILSGGAAEAGEELRFTEIRLERGHEDIGKKLRDCSLVKGALVMLVRRMDLVIIPKGELVLRQGDVLIVHYQEGVISNDGPILEEAPAQTGDK